MDAGFSVKTSNGTIVIDESFKNLSLTRKVSLSSMAVGTAKRNITPWLHFKQNPTYGNVTTYTLGVLENNEYLVALVADDWNKIRNKIFVESLEAKQGSYTFDVVPGGTVSEVYAYIFGVQEKKATGNYGIHVFDKIGNCIYDSQKKYLKIIGIQFQSSSMEHGKKYGFITTPQLAVSIYGAQQNRYCYYYASSDHPDSGFSIPGDWIRCGFYQEEGLTLSEAWGYDISALICDVTGY